MKNTVIAFKVFAAWLVVVLAAYGVFASVGALTFFSLSAFNYAEWHPVARFLHAVISFIFFAAACSVGGDEMKKTNY